MSLLTATGVFTAGAIIRAQFKHRNKSAMPPASYEASTQAYGDPPPEFVPYRRPTGAPSPAQRQRIAEQAALNRRTLPRPAPCTLTTRDLEHVNVRRRLQGRHPLNRNGFQTAIASARHDTPVDANNWLLYLIAYNMLTADHASLNVGGCSHISIDPGQPFNGQGGEFAGAGASGSWDSPPSAAPAPGTDPYASLADTARASVADFGAGSAGLAAADLGPDPLSYTPPVPDSTPSYTPDPTPSYSPDPSPSFDSSSSFSSSPDTSSNF